MPGEQIVLALFFFRDFLILCLLSFILYLPLLSLKMKVYTKISSTLILALFSISLSSCFDLKEKVYLKKDGSGTFSFTIDMSQSKLFLDMAKRLSDDQNSSPTRKVHSSFDESKETLEKIKGITNVQSIMDEQNYVFGFKFDFANVNALNEAIAKTIGKDKNNKDYVQYRYNKGVFERLEDNILKSKIEGEVKKNEKAEAFSASNIFHDVRYITEFTFESKVKNVDQEKAQISADGKTVTLTQMIFDESAEVKSLKSTIRF